MERVSLPVGTIIQSKNGQLYRIIDLLGCGGSSLVYSAIQITDTEPDGIVYALKECFPASNTCSFHRTEDGDILPDDPKDLKYLHSTKEQLKLEKAISQVVYRTATRSLPIREYIDDAVITLPGKQAHTTQNLYIIMDSLSGKGTTLRSYQKEHRRTSPSLTFHIIQQLLFAVREIHNAGYLFLDIQDGNIFIRSTWGDSSDLILTLIDFGCSRPLLEDGKCPVISDRALFTTMSYAAPEIRLKNDGTLRLGVQTDIYSIGVLTLQLLTGKHIDSTQLDRKQDKNFLQYNDLRRLNLPKYLSDQIQEILVLALNYNSEKRYSNCDQMLTDVADLLEKLHRYLKDPVGESYDAYISYKHGPDTKIARLIQSNLEGLRVPRSVCGNPKPINRVFLDEGELSASSDLGFVLANAINNSNYLILLCSPGSKESAWVGDEIHEFLKHHDKSHILCVWTSGEKEDAFREEFLGTYEGSSECLAVEVRADSYKEQERLLRGDALLRLAAPIIGTTFDALKQRQKIRRLKQIASVTAAVLAVSVGFGAYAINRATVIAKQNKQISEDYRNSQIQDSIHLASEAEALNEKNDPFGAIRLSLQALPSEEDNRPYVAEADKALIDALKIYDSIGNLQVKPSLSSKIDLEDNSNLWQSPDKKYIVELSDLSCISVVDTGTSLCREIPLSASSDNSLCCSAYSAENHILFLVTYFNVYAVNLEDGAEIWSAAVDNARSAAVSDDTGTVYVISDRKYDVYGYDDCKGRDFALTLTSLSQSSGSVITSRDFTAPHYDISKMAEQHYDGVLPRESCISCDSRYLAFLTYYSDGYLRNSDHYTIQILDLESQALVKSISPDTVVIELKFLDDNSLIAAYGNSYSLSIYSESGYIYDVNYPDTIQIALFTPDSLSQKWNASEGFYGNADYKLCEHSFKEIRYKQSDGTYADGILFVCCNKAILLNRETGEIEYLTELTSGIVNATTVRTALEDTPDVEAGVDLCSSDGFWTRAIFELDSTSTVENYFGDNVASVYTNSDSSNYYVSYYGSNSLYVYTTDTDSSNFHRLMKIETLEDQYYPSILASTAANTDYIVMYEGSKLWTIRTDDASILESESPESEKDYNFYGCQVIGVSGNCLVLHKVNKYISDGGDTPTYISIDLSTGELTFLYELPADTQVWNSNLLKTKERSDTENDCISCVCSRNGDRIYCLTEDGIILQNDLKGNPVSQLDLNETVPYSGYSFGWDYTPVEWVILDESTIALKFSGGMYVMYDGGEELKMLFLLKDAVGYNSGERAFLCANSLNIGTYHYYTTAEEIELARNFIDN